MTDHDDRLYLIHIRECIERIERYTSEGKADFFSNTKTQDSVLRNLHTLTESTQRMSESLKSTRSDVDWRSIARFRNVVVHGYLGVDLNQIWDIVVHDLPALRSSVEFMLQEYE